MPLTSVVLPSALNEHIVSQHSCDSAGVCSMACCLFVGFPEMWRCSDLDSLRLSEMCESDREI